MDEQSIRKLFFSVKNGGQMTAKWVYLGGDPGLPGAPPDNKEQPEQWPQEGEEKPQP